MFGYNKKMKASSNTNLRLLQLSAQQVGLWKTGAQSCLKPKLIVYTSQSIFLQLELSEIDVALSKSSVQRHV